MINNVLKRIFEFLEEKEQQNPPFLWKHMNDMPLTKEELIVKGDLRLQNSKITSLPKGLNQKYNHCQKIWKLVEV
jgi:hypothetical protein